MKLNYKLTNYDFLEYQLYASSKSPSHKKRRWRARIVVPIVYAIIGLLFTFSFRDNVFGIIFIVAGVLWLVCYPTYSKWKIKKHFQKHVEENYKNRINKAVEIIFDGTEVSTKDFTSESKINGSELKALIETKNHFFIKLATDLSLIVPKHAIEDMAAFKSLVTEMGAAYLDERHWEWK